MDQAIFIGFCLILGCVVLAQVPFNVRTVDKLLIGKLLYILVMVSAAGFFLSLAGTGITLAANQSHLAYIMEGAANITGLALMASIVIVTIYGLARYLVRRLRITTNTH